MQNRWTVLALLFTVRLTMGFQFQAVGAVSPLYMKEFGVALADIGLIIGLYHAPGIVFAVPGGEIGRRFGDKPIVLLSLALMIIGGLIMAYARTWGWQLGGRLVAGIGGVLLNVIMSKMVTDWFAGKELATAMGFFVNSWPLGIALSLVVLPLLAVWGGLIAVGLSTAVFCAVGLLLLGMLYAPPDFALSKSEAGIWPTGPALKAVVVAGCIWGLFNAAFSMIFGFGTALLTERGWSLTAAGSATSVALWMGVVSVPLGGIIADRTGRHRDVMLTGFALFGVFLVFAARSEAVAIWFAALGLAAGLSAGPIMSLPARVLDARARAAGMGLYYSVFYVMVIAGPIIGGWLAVLAGTSRATFDFGALLLAACFPLYALYEHLRSRHAGTAAHRA